MKKESVIEAIENMISAMEKVSELWEDNIEGFNLNDSDSYQYPFEDSFDEVINKVYNWCSEVGFEIECEHNC